MREMAMGNFKPVAMRTMNSGRERRRSILKGSIGVDGDNLPNDMRLIARALIEAGLLGPDAPQEDVKHAICRAIRHIRRTTDELPTNASDKNTLIPESDTDLMMRRALAELRFSISHRTVALSASPKGARAVFETGVFLAKQRLKENSQAHETPPAFRRATLPPLSPNAYQSNRRLAEAVSKTNFEGLDDLISESIRHNDKAGFVEVRDFFNVLTSYRPESARSLGEKVKRRLRGKPRRRFIKLMQNVPPNEDDFVDGPS
jgi:hypothetical protein